MPFTKGNNTMKKDWSKYGARRHTKEWYQIKLVDFLKINFPDKIKFNPSVIKITDDKVYFGMQKHFGTLVISKKSLENFDN